ncbi:hypothetical protein Tco_1058383 [Tanacetum coccineum]|uniref:Uncharacterized protein n=1 Tax=Tanacetum coccineum TaxID=301880 RepID=A0ABQ5H906_9ASTR
MLTDIAKMTVNGEIKSDTMLKSKLMRVRAISFYILLGGGVNDWKISWVKWDSVINKRDKGRLGISSLKASNLALLYKWRWRFMNDHDSKWVKVIKSIHSRDSGFGTSDWNPVGNGVWATIVKVVDQMHEKQIIPLDSMALQLGNGRNVSFWNDIWVGEHRLRDKFPRVFDMDSNKKCSIAKRWVQDQWVWTWNRSIRSESRTKHQLKEMLLMCGRRRTSTREVLQLPRQCT